MEFLSINLTWNVEQCYLKWKPTSTINELILALMSLIQIKINLSVIPGKPVFITLYQRKDKLYSKNLNKRNNFSRAYKILHFSFHNSPVLLNFNYVFFLWCLYCNYYINTTNRRGLRPVIFLVLCDIFMCHDNFSFCMIHLYLQLNWFR